MTAPARFDRFLDRVPVLGRFRRARGWLRRNRIWFYLAIAVAVLFVVRPVLSILATLISPLAPLLYYGGCCILKVQAPALTLILPMGIPHMGSAVQAFLLLDIQMATAPTAMSNMQVSAELSRIQLEVLTNMPCFIPIT